MKGALQHLNQQQQQQHRQHAAVTGSASLPADLAQADSIQAQGIMAQDVSSAAACKVDSGTRKATCKASTAVETFPSCLPHNATQCCRAAARRCSCLRPLQRPL
jgi:hypothetical protein